MVPLDEQPPEAGTQPGWPAAEATCLPATHRRARDDQPAPPHHLCAIPEQVTRPFIPLTCACKAPARQCGWEGHGPICRSVSALTKKPTQPGYAGPACEDGLFSHSACHIGRPYCDA